MSLNHPRNGFIVQLRERLPCKQEVESLSLSKSTTAKSKITYLTAIGSANKTTRRWTDCNDQNRCGKMMPSYLPFIGV